MKVTVSCSGFISPFRIMSYTIAAITRLSFPDEKLRYTLTPFANTFRILVLAAWQTSTVVSICFTGIFPYRSEDR